MNNSAADVHFPQLTLTHARQPSRIYPKKNRNGTIRPGPHQHLAEEFERRRTALQEAGEIVPRNSARCPQATHHSCHRPVWAESVRGVHEWG